MPLTIQTLSLTPEQHRAAARVNQTLQAMPRFKPEGWRFRLGMQLNAPASRVVGQLSAMTLKRRGVTVSTLSLPTADAPVPLRLLIPAEPPRALVIDLHGGGWVLGSAALNDPLTRHLVEAGFAVASVDYRLLDEARRVTFHDQVADCAAALRWAVDEGRTRFGVWDLFVIGESAGAHLAALAVLKLRDGGGARLPLPIFVQGAFDLSGTPSVHAADARTLLFDGPNLAAGLRQIAPERDEAALRSPDLSPLHADLTGMPPALFIAGELDPLQDDTRLMARAWSTQADATLLEVPAAAHGFQHFGGPTVALAQAFIRDWIEAHLTPNSVYVDKPST
ncbi:alpha/beta hydrolase [Brevundimonas sp.]|uniref:alpha/beta hydrolase n=1 Tax=Brevundimonas sp. TaxID=1871086 RepID=UPI003D0FDE45